jgi:DNA polymerase I
MQRIQVQILDCDYIMLNGKPLVRVFGKTEDGETVCVFSNKTLPYFYLLPTSDTETISKELKKKFDVEVEEVEKFLPLGFQEKPTKVLKIIGKDPSKTPEIREFVKKFGVPYEADILFKYRFLVDNDLGGMYWLEAKGNFASTKTVKCKAFEAEEIRPIERHDNAPLRYLCFDIECITEENRIPNAEKDPIVIISVTFHPEYKGKKYLILLAKPFGAENIMGFENEKKMLEKFIEVVLDYDPDIVTGYNINNFDLPYLVKRLEVHKLPRDLGRAEKPVMLKKLPSGTVPTMVGRVVVDPYEIIKRDPWLRFKRYDLGTISKHFLGEDKIEIKGLKEMRELWNGNIDDLMKFIAYCKRDSELALRLIIEKNLLDQFFELAKISGLLLQDVFGGQSQRHECRLLHEFKKRNLILPCKPDEKEIRRRKKEREIKGLKGALVLEPKVGLHKDNCVLVLDFASLYPSIIRTFNICPTTLLSDEQTKKFEHVTSPSGAKFVSAKVREGVFPAILRELIETRRLVKKQMKEEKDPEKRRILNAKQLALKTMANSLYGYTAFLPARLYILDVANSITAFGRENIKKTKKLIEENFDVEVVYGDTDSMFIKTKISSLEEAEKLGKEISEFVTKNLPGFLSLEFEKIYKSFLILTKKRYAGWTFERDSESVTGWKDKIDMKGIETVRRDWCSLTSETMEKVIDIILKEGNIYKAAEYVRKVIKDLSEGRIPLEKLTIVKGLTKDPEEYDGVQPHVELVKKMRLRDPTKAPIVGDRIEFVIVKGNQLLSKRAEDPEWVREHGLEIDSYYYIENQILPPIERIFEVCGISKTELLEGSKQQSLFDFKIEKPNLAAPEQIVLDGFEVVTCKNCNWSFRRPPLSGVCPSCKNTLYFAKDGFIATKVKIAC